MPNSDLKSSMKYEHVNLQEDLIFFKSQNIYLHGKIQDLEDEMRILKEKLVKFTAVEEKIKKNYHLNYQLGSYFPDKLLKKVGSN